MNDEIKKFKNKEYELCILGYFFEGNYYSFDFPMTNYSKDYVIVEPILMLKFIKYCILHKYSPVIIHNHVDNSIFSEPDLYFMKQYQKLYRKCQGCEIMYFIVINSKSLEYSVKRWNQEDDER
ncbi:hypothetical protein [uncultured Dubosiella sp.]|uniref:hypothetical protein n=1 Tax=uncultured Dubosiella sp. TaxID=1937011 RepID=UPI00273080FF|nr:hypothetical protein [uncultured Dubosiella sp.]